MKNIEREGSFDSVGTILLLRDDDALLMQLRDNKKGLRRAGMWVPPGGHSEKGENMDACAIREFKEETNYNCSSMEFLAEFKDHVDGWAPYMLTVFWSVYDGVQQFQCLEGQDLKFIKRDKVELYTIPDNILILWDKVILLLNRNEK